jgi:ABC-type polysaccharide/polyol phosphate transport system ATPase subunit
VCGMPSTPRHLCAYPGDCSVRVLAGHIRSETHTDTKIIYSMVGVGKTYPPSKQVLRDISLSYFYGAKIGVIGLNGAGKSTLLRIMAGVEKGNSTKITLCP